MSRSETHLKLDWKRLGSVSLRRCSSLASPRSLSV